MTTIGSFAAGRQAGTLSAERITGLKSQFDTLTRQLSTGAKAETYGGLGVGRRTSLDARARLAALAGYDSGIDIAQQRVKLASLSITQVVKTVSDTRSDLLTVTGKGSPTADTLRGLVTERLETAIDALNQKSGDSYLFAGRATTTEPVETADRILNGDPAKGLAGVSQLIAERTAADLGAGSLKTGRLTLTAPSAGGTGVALAEDPNASTRANFGFRILAASTTNANALTATATPGTASTAALTFASQPAEGDVVRVAINNADGSPGFLDLVATANPAPGSTTQFAIGTNATATGANLTALLSGKAVASAQSATPPSVSLALSGGSAGGLSLAVTGPPAAGDTITVTLGLRDGTTTTLTLNAIPAGTATGDGSFSVGATNAETATNLSAALSRALDGAANGALAASSAVLGAKDFFAGQTTPGLAPRRIAGGSPFTGATGFATASGTSTVAWYKGETTSDPRSTAPVQVGTGRSVGTGAAANEPALRDTLAAFAAFAAGAPATGSGQEVRYAALAQRVAAALGPPDGKPSVADIGTELAQASTAMSAAKADHRATSAILDDAVQGVEGVSLEEVTTRLLALQTQLQASYQTTSMLSKLSLVNFL